MTSNSIINNTLQDQINEQTHLSESNLDREIWLQNHALYIEQELAVWCKDNLPTLFFNSSEEKSEYRACFADKFDDLMNQLGAPVSVNKQFDAISELYVDLKQKYIEAYPENGEW